MGLRDMVDYVQMVKDLRARIDAEPDLVDCPNKHCKVYGENLDCYLDLYHNCEKYTKWKYAIQLGRALKKRKLKDFRKL